MSHLKGLQWITPDEQGARALCVPPITILLVWLRNKIHFAGVVDTHKTTGFLIRNEYKVSHLKGLQTTTPDESGAQVFIYLSLIHI